MKKRLRRKLGKGEYAHPYPVTKAMREGNARVLQWVQGIYNALGPDEFLRRIAPLNEAV